MKSKIQSLTDTYKLNNGVAIPGLGFGTWQSKDGKVAYDAVEWALEAGFRHIDTAYIYGNEKSVGKAIKDSGIKREELFITTKLWNSKRSTYDDTLKAFEESLQNLGLDYVDMYLIHWPDPLAFRDSWQEVNAKTWQAMETIYDSKRARAIGISNFRKVHIEELQKTWKIKPQVNQIFLNPGDPETELVNFNRSLDIFSEAYSPLGTGKLLNNSIVVKVANDHHKSPAQILIRWSLEQGFISLPKSIHEPYIKADTDVFDFELTENDYRQLTGLDGLTEQHSDPDQVDF